MRPIAQFYDWLTSIGITDELSFSEKLRVELNNLFLGIALPCLFLHLLYLIFVESQLSSYVITVTWIFILLVPLYLNHRHKFFAARVYTIAIPVLAIAAVHLLHGFNIRLEPVYLMMILMCSFFFKRKLSIIMSGFVILTYLTIAVLLSGVITPPLAARIIPSVPIMYLTFSIAASIILIRKVLVENEGFNEVVSAQNETLAKKNKRLEKFTYIASHDLKTPIRNITSFARLIERDIEKMDYERLPDHLDFIRSSALQMAALVEDILQISTMDYADSELRSDNDLDDIVAHVSRSLLTEFKDENAEIVNSGLPNYFCSASEMYLVFHNLIQNGLKYNQQTNPKVELWSEQNNGHLLVHIRDNGIGIDSEYHDHIFEF
ncbi:MAG: histidine kinase dimerization/phospho-acceptor domain-containing protein, partial [Bacteroidota bacterium]